MLNRDINVSKIELLPAFQYRYRTIIFNCCSFVLSKDGILVIDE